jgi:hypothetical protein
MKRAIIYKYAAADVIAKTFPSGLLPAISSGLTANENKGFLPGVQIKVNIVAGSYVAVPNGY